MKIVHVITRLIVGGAQENTLLSAEGQHAAGHDVTLITGPSPGREGSMMPRALSGGYRVEVCDALVRAVNPRVDYRAFRWLSDWFITNRPDVIHTHSSKAGIVGRWAAARSNRLHTGDRHSSDADDRVRRAKIIHTIHGLAFTASRHALVNSTYKVLERHAAKCTDKIVCVADAMRDASLAAGIGRPEQYVTVYSGMETSAFLNPARSRGEVRAELGLSETDIVVGTIARLFHMKGHDDLLRLAPGLCEKHPMLKFLWVGDGLLRDEFERKINQLHLTGRFVFTGLVPPARVPELATAMDILVHPSRREGLARALPQGQLAGCPAVTYDIDGNREGLINDTVDVGGSAGSGYLVPPFDVDKLGRRLSELLQDPVRAREMGARGRRFAVERFDTAVMVRRLEEVYQ